MHGDYMFFWVALTGRKAREQTESVGYNYTLDKLWKLKLIIHMKALVASIAVTQ